MKAIYFAKNFAKYLLAIKRFIRQNRKPMKIIVSILFLIIIPFVGFSQTVNGAPLKELDAEHILIVGNR